ncbi:MAG: hypothetical protein PHT33_15615 [bacterium]|nr:hypothetical protein [bacterium]
MKSKITRLMLLTIAAVSILQGSAAYSNVDSGQRQLVTSEIMYLKHNTTKDHPLYYASLIWPYDAIAIKRVPKEKIPQPEVERTLYWMKRVFRTELLPADTADRIIYLPDMDRGDDWSLMRFSDKDGNEYQIIDGRSLTAVARPKQENRLDSWENNEDVSKLVISTYKTLLKYDYRDAPNVSIDIMALQTDTSGCYGRINSRGFHNGWLEKDTVKWWSNGQVVIFYINKIIALPYVKGGPMGLIKRAKEYVGGIGDEDTRPFKRFDKAVDDLYLQEEFRRVYAKAQDDWRKSVSGKTMGKNSGKESQIHEQLPEL